MNAQENQLANAYIQAVNHHNPLAYMAVFAEDAVVDDNGREFRGREAIRNWSQSDIFDVDVTFDVLEVAETNGETLITTKVDGNFDRTGLPDPVVIVHRIKRLGDKIIALSCRLADQ